MGFKLDLHVHSENHGRTFIDEKQLARAIRANGIDGVAVTNFFSLAHARWLQAKIPEHLIIVGQEIWSRDGHIIGLGMKKEVDDFLPAAETVQRVHEQGGIAVAVHPFLHLGVGALTSELPVDAIEVYNAVIGGFWIYNFQAQRLARKIGAVAIASSDTTDAALIGKCHTEVLTDDKGHVLEAIRKGQVRLVRKALPVPIAFIAKCFLNFKNIEPCSIHAVPCPVCGHSMASRLLRTGHQCLVCGVTQYTRVACSNGHFVCTDCIAKKIKDRDRLFEKSGMGTWSEISF